MGVHNVRNAVSPQNTSIRYVKINVATSTAVEDVAFGATNYWYSYPAIELDKDLNLAITYSRSSTTEYIGAYYSYRINTDPPGLRGSSILQTGKGNYVKDYSSGRNRWGDYMGIWLDPSDNYSMWMFTEYAAGTNLWGTWTGKVRLVPFTGIQPVISSTLLQFGNIEVNTPSDSLSVVIANYGEEDLVIISIPAVEGAFNLASNLSFPLTLQTYDSLAVTFIFSPVDTGLYTISYPVNTNDNSFTGINLTGYSYTIKPAQENILYAVSGSTNNSLSLQLNKETGAGTVIGPAKITEIRSIAVDPQSNVIYGVSQDNYIVRYNAEKGDAYNLFPTNLTDVFSVAFDNQGEFYCIQKTGELYKVNLIAGTLEQVSKAKINVSDIAFHPQTNEMFASIYIAVGANKDRIFKVDVLTGDTVSVGKTGFSNTVNGLAFDASGVLYGVNGASTQVNNLITINTSNGTGTLIGSTGYNHITGIALRKGNPVSAQNTSQIPVEFEIKQNYPNPFNPSTLIEFSLPEASRVKVTIFNLLGETVDVLLNSDRTAGTHKVTWDASSGNLSSGIYFYEVKATGISGKENSSIRKMILMK
jgi:hypothetical protein